MMIVIMENIYYHLPDKNFSQYKNNGRKFLVYHLPVQLWVKIMSTVHCYKYSYTVLELDQRFKNNEPKSRFSESYSKQWFSRFLLSRPPAPFSPHASGGQAEAAMGVAGRRRVIKKRGGPESCPGYSEEGCRVRLGAALEEHPGSESYERGGAAEVEYSAWEDQVGRSVRKQERNLKWI